MFGQMLFAELPFAEAGRPPYLEAGWIKVCPSSGDWVKQPKNNVNTIECGDFRPTNIPRK